MYSETRIIFVDSQNSNWTGEMKRQYYCIVVPFKLDSILTIGSAGRDEKCYALLAEDGY
jgi:hypothetical protein